MKYAVALLLGLLVAEAVAFWFVIERDLGIGADAWFYRNLGDTWLETGQWYLPRQFEPHTFEAMADNVYPPSALPLFVAFALTPWPLWWVVPIAVLVYCLYRWRPSPVAWIVILLLLIWPRSIGGYLYGNTSMWTAAIFAAGLTWGYPVALLIIKPSVMFWGVLAIRDKRAWIGAVVVAVLSLPMLPLWLDYITIMRNTTDTHPIVLLGDIPMMLVPVVAWLGRRDHRRILRRDVVPAAVLEREHESGGVVVGPRPSEG